jgi:hypothetical protein
LADEEETVNSQTLNTEDSATDLIPTETPDEADEASEPPVDPADPQDLPDEPDGQAETDAPQEDAESDKESE